MFWCRNGEDGLQGDAVPLPRTIVVAGMGFTVTCEFVTIPELAKRVHVSSEHLYRLARINELPGCITLGHRYTVNFDVFLEQSKIRKTTVGA